MEAIKCPNCGSEKVQGLTEEKYVCLACDNVFLVHNLSKEFRQTDEHITDVHEDLSKKLDSINVNLKAVETVGNTDNTKAKEILFEAEQELKKGDFLKSYTLFEKYTAFVPNSYVGYEGMFRALTDDYKDDAGEYKALAEGTNIYDCLLDGTDVLKKALECDDADKESILSKFEQFYNRSAKTLKVAKYGEEDQKQQNILDAQQKVTICEYALDNLLEKNATAEEFDNLAGDEKNETRLKQLIPFFIILTIFIFTFGGSGILIKIVLFIALIVTGKRGFAKPKKVEEDELNQKKQELENARAYLAALQEDESEEAEENSTEKFMELICENTANVATADELYNRYSELENPQEKAVYDVVLESYGNNKAPGPIINIIIDAGGFKLDSSMYYVPQIAMRRVPKERALLLAENIEIAGGKARVCISDETKYFVVIKEAWHSISDSTWIEFELDEQYYSKSSSPQVVFETSDLDKAKRCKMLVERDTKGIVEIM